MRHNHLYRVRAVIFLDHVLIRPRVARLIHIQRHWRAPRVAHNLRSRPGTRGVGDDALLVLDSEVEGAGVFVEGLKTVRAGGAEAGGAEAGHGEGGGIWCTVPGEDAPTKGGSEMGEEEDDCCGEERHVSGREARRRRIGRVGRC